MLVTQNQNITDDNLLKQENFINFLSTKRNLLSSFLSKNLFPRTLSWPVFASSLKQKIIIGKYNLSKYSCKIPMKGFDIVA